MRAGLRATLAIFVGLFALVTGMATSVVHVIGEGASGVDYTGVLATAAGSVLMATGAVTLWRSRKLDRKAWRYGRRALIGIAGALVALQVVGGAALGYYATHRPESAVGEPSLGVAHQDVTLTTSDGLELEGWYVPSRNRAAVLVFPGRSGNKQHHARNLISSRLRGAPGRQSGPGRERRRPQLFRLGRRDRRQCRPRLPHGSNRRGCQPHWGARPLSGRRDAARDRSAYRSPSGGRVRGRGWEDLEGGPRDASTRSAGTACRTSRWRARRRPSSRTRSRPTA